MRVFVGITSYNTKEYIENCLSSLFGCATCPQRVHVVDNGSTDGTPEFLAGMDSNVVTHEISDRNSFAAGGARRAVDRFLLDDDCDVFLHLDADTEMRGEAIASLVQQIGSRQHVAVGVQVDKLMYAHPRSRSLRAFDKYIFGEWKCEYASGIPDEEFSKCMLKTMDDGTEVYRELCGWFLAMPKSLIRTIGNVDDERYGMWRWESEWVLRAAARGCDIEHAAAVEDGLVYHYGGRSRRRERHPERYASIARRDLR